MILGIDDLIPLVIAMILGVFGGTARFLTDVGKKKIRPRAFFINAFCTAFVGAVIYLGCLYEKVESTIGVYFFVCLASFAGPATLHALVKKYTKTAGGE